MLSVFRFALNDFLTCAQMCKVVKDVHVNKDGILHCLAFRPKMNKFFLMKGRESCARVLLVWLDV